MPGVSIRDSLKNPHNFQFLPIGQISSAMFSAGICPRYRVKTARRSTRDVGLAKKSSIPALMQCSRSPAMALAVQAMKRILRGLAAGTLDEAETLRLVTRCEASADLKEGLLARREDRTPKFRGH